MFTFDDVYHILILEEMIVHCCNFEVALVVATLSAFAARLSRFNRGKSSTNMGDEVLVDEQVATIMLNHKHILHGRLKTQNFLQFFPHNLLSARLCKERGNFAYVVGTLVDLM